VLTILPLWQIILFYDYMRARVVIGRVPVPVQHGRDFDFERKIGLIIGEYLALKFNLVTGEGSLCFLGRMYMVWCYI